MNLQKILLLTAAAWGATAAGEAAAATRDCSLESVRAIAPRDAVIDSVTPIDAPVAHCEVLGHIVTTNPGPGRVEFSVMLPDQRFNNRFYFVGLGAAAGFVPTARLTSDPLSGYYLTSTLKLLSEGFAVSGSDTGHKGMMWDFAIDNPVAKLDHGHRGAHVATVAAQAITRSYYDMSDRLYRYHLGCSGGGRMGSMAITHHPEDYDGVVVSTGFSGPGGGGSIWFAWMLQHVVRNPDGWLSPQKLSLLERRVADHCAGPDGLVRDPNSCGFKPESIQCRSGDRADCLTAAEVETVNVITGRYPTGPGTSGQGFTMTNPTAWSSFLLGQTRPTGSDPENPWAPGSPPSSFGIMQSILRGMYFNRADFNFLTDLDFDNPQHLEILRDNHPTWGAGAPDLQAYKAAGGKLMLWAPLGENAVPPATEFEYYDHLTSVDPDADSFMRLYAAPGVYHCAGGPGAQDTPDRLLDAVIAWREQGRGPGPIITNGAQPGRPTPGPDGTLPAPNPARTVLICPHPQVATFRGPEGAFAFDANNWACVAPEES